MYTRIQYIYARMISRQIDTDNIQRTEPTWHKSMSKYMFILGIYVIFIDLNLKEKLSSEAVNSSIILLLALALLWISPVYWSFWSAIS